MHLSPDSRRILILSCTSLPECSNLLKFAAKPRNLTLEIFFFVGILAFLVFGGYAIDWRNQAEAYRRETSERGTIQEQRDALKRERSETVSRAEALLHLANEKSAGFPTLATAWDEYLNLQDQRLSQELIMKSHPAFTAAAAVKEIGAERREAIRRAKICEYKNRLYESLFPWLTEFTEDGVDDAYLRAGPAKTGSADDPAKQWVPIGEWEKLSSAVRNQRALERYQSRPKTNWEIGREYERYVGYVYETKGCVVSYMGAIEGFDDLGRDLVVNQGKTTKIVQCKYWSEFRQIHEKHIFQLFGTTVEYALRKRFGDDYERHDLFGHHGLLEEIKPEFFTSTKLTDRARGFADALGIAVFELFKIEQYPMIKCNVARSGSEKIYHLPFDQQYDKVKIEKHRGEKYVATVAEAERLGFRRAFRWRLDGS
jgi:hypothetical protein